MKKVLLFCSLAVAATPVFAQDAGVVDETGCGDIEEGTAICDGDVLKFCDEGAIGELNCAQLFPGAPTGVCENLPNVGPYCSFADGDDCVFSTQSGDSFFFPCTNDTSGCVNGLCQANVGTCDGSAEPPASCSGDSPQVCASWNQYIVNTCDMWGVINQLDVAGSSNMTCTGQGICEGVTEGDSCYDGFFNCASGLSCEGATQESYGTCTADSNPNPNPNSDNASTTDPDDPDDPDEPEDAGPVNAGISTPGLVDAGLPTPGTSSGSGVRRTVPAEASCTCVRSEKSVNIPFMALFGAFFILVRPRKWR